MAHGIVCMEKDAEGCASVSSCPGPREIILEPYLKQISPKDYLPIARHLFIIIIMTNDEYNC